MFGANRVLRLCVVFAFVLGASFAQATLVVQRTVAELAARAQGTVWGRVLRVDVDTENGYRYAIVSATEAYNQSGVKIDQTEFSIRLENRIIPRQNLVERVSGAPDLKPGEEVFLLLSRDSGAGKQINAKVWVPTGFHQGIFRIFKDKNGQRRALSFRDWNAPQVSDSELKNQSLNSPIAPNASKPDVQQIKKSQLLSELLNVVRDAQARAPQRNSP